MFSRQFYAFYVNDIPKLISIKFQKIYNMFRENKFSHLKLNVNMREARSVLFVKMNWIFIIACVQSFFVCVGMKNDYGMENEKKLSIMKKGGGKEHEIIYFKMIQFEIG